MTFFHDDDDDRVGSAPWQRQRDRRRTLQRLAALVIAVAAVATIGWQVVSRRDSTSATRALSAASSVPTRDTATGTTVIGTDSATEVAGTDTRVSTESAPATDATATTVTTTAVTEATTAVTATTSAVTTTGAATTRPAVVALRIVPPVRDVLVTINGRQYASDAAGMISIAAPDRGGRAVIVGLRTTTPLQQAEFTGWSDGVTDAGRMLDSIDGPVAEIGFLVRYRVQAQAGIIPAGEGTVTFDAAATGPVTLVVGQPEWVLATRAVPSAQGLTTETVTYRAASLERGGTTTVLDDAAFVAAPEALWRVVP